jgi:hypothetical protein
MSQIIEAIKRALRAAYRFNEKRFAEYPYSSEAEAKWEKSLEEIRILPGIDRIDAMEELSKQFERDRQPRILDRLYRIVVYTVAFIVMLPVWILLAWIIDDLYPQCLSLLGTYIARIYDLLC